MNIIIGIIITAVIYLFIPFFIYMTGKKFKPTIAFLISLTNFILIKTIFFKFEEPNSAWLYFFIGMWLISSKENNKEEKKNDTVSNKQKEEKSHTFSFYPNPKLSDEENQKNYFLQMPLEELEDIVLNKKDEYNESTYKIATEQFEIRKKNTIEDTTNI